MVADQADVGPLGDDLTAAVRRRPVADDVAEAPDRVRRPRVDLLEHREQSLLVSVDVGDDCNARHRAVGNGSGFVRRVARRRVPALADERPVGLDVGGLDVHRFFSARAVERAADYQRFLDVLWLLHLVATIVALVVLSSSRAAPRAHARARTHRRRRDRGDADARHALVRLAPVRLRRAVVGRAARPRAARLRLVDLRAVGAALVRGAVRARVRRRSCSSLAGWLGDRWWLVGGPVFVAFAALFVFLSGWLLQFGTHGVHSARLRSDIRVLERREGVPGTPVHVQDVSDVTTQANAYSSGFGPSANVVLWNTLLDGRFSPGEVRVVVGARARPRRAPAHAQGDRLVGAHRAADRVARHRHRADAAAASRTRACCRSRC